MILISLHAKAMKKYLKSFNKINHIPCKLVKVTKIEQNYQKWIGSFIFEPTDTSIKRLTRDFKMNPNVS